MNQSTEIAVVRFLENRNIQKCHEYWRSAIVNLEAEPGTARNWFWFWCYQNICVEGKYIHHLAPNGFTVGTVWTSHTANSNEPLVARSLKQIHTIHIPDPSYLYRKLNIDVARIRTQIR